MPANVANLDFRLRVPKRLQTTSHTVFGVAKIFWTSFDFNFFSANSSKRLLNSRKPTVLQMLVLNVLLNFFLIRQC